MKKQILFAFATSALMVGVHAQEAPTPELGCQVFDAHGKIISQVEKLTDKQLMQALNCWDVLHAQNARAQAAVDAYVKQQDRQSYWETQGREAFEKSKALNDEFNRSGPAFGGGAQIPYPPPGNATTIILQTQ